MAFTYSTRLVCLRSTYREYKIKTTEILTNHFNEVNEMKYKINYYSIGLHLDVHLHANPLYFYFRRNSLSTRTHVWKKQLWIFSIEIYCGGRILRRISCIIYKKCIAIARHRFKSSCINEIPRNLQSPIGVPRSSRHFCRFGCLYTSYVRLMNSWYTANIRATIIIIVKMDIRLRTSHKVGYSIRRHSIYVV